MASKSITALQYPLYATAVLGPSNGSDTVTLDLPSNAVLVGGVVRINTAGADTINLTVKDGTTSHASVFGDVAIDTAGATAMTTTGLGLSYPAGTTLTVALSASDNTVKATVVVAYVISGRQNETFSA